MRPAAQSRLQWQSAVDGAVEAALARSTPGATTDELLRELRDSPTDLAKLVGRVDQRRCGAVAISPKAIRRWNKDDPMSWARVREWLTSRGVCVVEV